MTPDSVTTSLTVNNGLSFFNGKEEKEDKIKINSKMDRYLMLVWVLGKRGFLPDKFNEIPVFQNLISHKIFHDRPLKNRFFAKS
jgi:hypothetical protein